jgi:hypothetical protein
VSRTTERRRRWQPPRFIDEEIDEQHLRTRLVEQHDRLRAMLTRLETTATEIIRRGVTAAPKLAADFATVATAFDDHTRGEERALAKLLPRTAAAKRALAFLHEDHRCQREELRAMSRLAACCDDGITLALAVRGFVSNVRLDMDAEDRLYLSGRPFETEAAETKS